MSPEAVETEGVVEALQSTEPSTRRRLVYAIVGLLLLFYMASAIAFTSVYAPNLQFFSYYAVAAKALSGGGSLESFWTSFPLTSTSPAC